MHLGPARGLWIFFALTPLGASAALNLPMVGGASIVLADAAALTLFVVLILRKGSLGRLLASARPPSSGFWLLVLYIFAIFATIYFPRIFAGHIEVFGIARTIDGKTGIVVRPLQPTSGNITQLFRLSLGVMIFATLATSFRRNPDSGLIVKALAADTAVHVTFGFLDVFSFNLGAPHILDVFRTANYAMAVDQVMAGIKRMAGGFPEASAFGFHTMGLFGFWLQYVFDRGQFRFASAALLATLTVLILSTSSSAYVAAMGLFFGFAIFNWRSLLSASTSRYTAWILGGTLAMLPIIGVLLVLSYQLVPEVHAYLDRVLFNKLATDSGIERMSWNAQAFRNFLGTWMIGAGLGSVRASNWLLSSLASLGVVGTMIFVVFLISVFRSHPPPAADRETLITIRALKMACLGILARALVTKATPNLELAFFAMSGLIAGLVSSAQHARTRSPSNLIYETAHAQNPKDQPEGG